MTETKPLDPQLTEHVLSYLGISPESPSPDALDRLVTAYTQRVPWESASRIARRARIHNPAACPRWPEIFWTEALTQHTGGTCFESNYAFWSLLRALGYEGYLTINNMHDSIACHTAIVVHLENTRYLVDAGFPVHLPLPLDSNQQTSRETPYFAYTATPLPNGNYSIERTLPQSPYCFTLIDKPISDKDYRQATTNDYGDGGLFLDQVIVMRVVEGKVWRYKGGGMPYQLEQFDIDKTTYHFLGDTIPEVVEKIAQKFDMDVDMVKQAMTIVDKVMNDKSKTQR